MSDKFIRTKCTHQVSKMQTYELPDGVRDDYWERYQRILAENPDSRKCEARTKAYHAAIREEIPLCPAGCRAE